MIFKNEARCLERCLESLKPLRAAAPCELVMANTGSEDGSREIAARYADILFDFPWIDDFSAARNAVMDRCSGKWYLSIDADEWLDPNIEELLKFLTRRHNFNFFGVKIRNYKSAELEAGGLYMDSTANRMIRMSTGMRFQNPIHEGWDATGQPIIVLSSTIFYHDGYLFAQPGSREAKEKRNLAILRRALEKEPGKLGLLLQSFESSYLYPGEHLDYIRRAIQGVEEKRREWEKCGPAIYRHGVAAAFMENLPELDEWIARAEELFPDSIITRLDVNHTALGLCWNRGDYAECVRRGEAYFEAVKDYESGNFNIRDVTASPPLFASANWQQTARGFLAGAYLCENQLDMCVQTLKELLSRPLDEKQTEEGVRTLVRLHMLTEVDTVPLVLALWERVNEPGPTPEAAKKRLEILNTMGFGVFQPDFRLEEGGRVIHPAWGLFAPLENKCGLGRAAALYGAKNLPELNEKLAMVKDWAEMPICVLAHALERGAEFPVPGRPLCLEEMDDLAGRLAQDGDVLAIAAAQLAQDGGSERLVQLFWVRELVLAALQMFKWEDGDAGLDLETIRQGMDLAQAFAQLERILLPRCYAEEMLEEENLFCLPPVHRFGWYCAQAFEALDSGDQAGYVRLLREGLAVSEDKKHMVEFLADHTPALQALVPSDELSALADQIRAVLSRFAPDDPAVAALKQSEAYQKVAYLIGHEGALSES